MKECDLNGDSNYGYFLFMAVSNPVGQFPAWICELHNENNWKKRAPKNQTTKNKKEVRVNMGPRPLIFKEDFYVRKRKN